jgi:hypothetical protein
MKTTTSFRGRRFAITATMCAALLLAACHEIPQDAAKPFAGTEDVKPYIGGMFKGDRDLFEKTLEERAKTQDEYLRTGGAKQ